MNNIHKMYETGFNDGLNNKSARYPLDQTYMQGYDQGKNQRKENVRRVALAILKR